MQVQIIYNRASSTGRGIKAVYGRRTYSAYLAAPTPRGLPGFVSVMEENASHKAWNMLGRTFPNLVAAAAGFKRPEALAFVADIARGFYDQPDTQIDPPEEDR